MQEEIINAVLQKKDVLALLPTGGGKSVCFQVPALMTEGLCIVISPLIALMKDQVESLRRKNITAFSIHSGMNRREVINTLKVAGESNCKFLYVSPERLETSLFKEYLPSFTINLIAVDEAHCISQWGYDFRPPYLRIATLREELPGVPVLALTASATKEVQGDICEKLTLPLTSLQRRGEKEWEIFQQSFERANLSYSIFNVDVKINKIKEILQKVPGSSIVYCRNRKRTKEIADLLNMQGIDADYYHAGLTSDERNKKQEAWISNKTRVIVSTNAFGMGIDKPDVRTVIHADVPDCLENYYQEAGRAGRDEKKSYAVLLYTHKELNELKLLPDVHFPVLEKIREVYQSVMNYLQIPSGSGEGNYYDFDITDFIKKFKLDAQLVVHALKALEQEGLVSFNEQVFLPSKVAFSTNKELLYDFENANPDLEPVIKILLRTYPAIFDQSVSIHEKTIAFLIKKEPDAIIIALKKLHSFGIIQYIPQKDSPQLYFIQNRIKAEDLAINQTNYKKRKERYEKRIALLLEYVNAAVQCRSQFIANYFGDENAKPCGICDNCLKQKNTDLSKEEFENIHQQIVQIITSNSIDATQLLQHLPNIKKEKAWKVINHLQAENILVVDKNGIVKTK
ncbi:MAG: RecQ family ATP-dependent DNA helicase [Bacteroidetes bacterium]|nr:RecQ family ATP-dependent DNA helicase [Bacteroidota bacterium]